MKYVYSFFAVLIFAATVLAGDTSLTQRDVRDPRKLENWLETKVVTTNTIYQSDNGITTTASEFTPAFIGQFLIGGAGAGTTGVWIAKDITTNGWTVLAP